MKLIVKYILFCTMFLFLNISYSYSIDSEVMEDEEYDYDSTIVQSSASEKHSRIETREKSEYDIDMKPYGSVKYTTHRTKIEVK